MFFRKKTSCGRAYLQIVENRREDGAVRQQVIGTLGRLEDLCQSGQLERLLRSGARFANKAIVVGAVTDGESTVRVYRAINEGRSGRKRPGPTGARFPLARPRPNPRGWIAVAPGCARSAPR
jgi:hypothetical protein